MWIPIVVILWQLGPAQVWLNFPQPTFPFESLEPDCGIYAVNSF